MQTHAVVVLALVVTACVFDVRTRRIPNLLTLGGALAALATAFVQGGVSALGLSATGWLVAVLLFFPFFVLHGMGAGDVKLLGAIGAWLGPLNALYLAVFTALAGGVCALVVVLLHGYFQQTFRNLWLLMTHWRVGGIRPLSSLTLEQGQGPRLAYAIPIALGTVTTLWLR